MGGSVAGNGFVGGIFVVVLFVYFCALACATLRARGAHKNGLRVLSTSHAERAGGCWARAVLLASQKSEARGERRSERSERAKLTSPPTKTPRQRSAP